MKYSFRREDGTFLCNDGAWADDADDALIVDTDWPDVLADELDAKAVLSPYLNGERVIYVLIEETRGDVNPVYRDEMPLIFPLLDEEELDELFTRLWLRFEPLTMEEKAMTEGLEIKQSVYDLVKDWLDGMPVGVIFLPTEIQAHIIHKTGGKRCPHDATITRYLRLYNERGGSIKCVSRTRSAYQKRATTGGSHE